MSTRPRIYADFNGYTTSPRDPSRMMVPLDTWGSLRDLANAGVRLAESTKLVIHDAGDEHEDLEAAAETHYDPEHRWWYAELEHELLHVPAGDRTPDPRFLCVRCRIDLGERIGIKPGECCPHCGESLLAPIAAP